MKSTYFKSKCCQYTQWYVVNFSKNEGYLHGADEGHLPQKWFSLGPEAVIHPSQNRCHSGSTGGSGPVARKNKQVSAVAITTRLLESCSKQREIWADGCVCVCVSTDRLVFDGGTRYTEVQLAVLLDAGIDQSLHWALILEEEEGIACTKHSEVIQAAGDTEPLCWNLVPWLLGLNV